MLYLYLCISFALASISIDLHSKFSSKEEATEDWISKKSKLSSYSLPNLGNLIYSCEISIGTPPQKFNFQIHTGSSSFWIVEADCGFCHKCNNTFDPTASSTFKWGPYETSIYYWNTEIYGRIGSDIVGIGNKKVNNFTFLVDSEESFTYGLEMDGLLGLSFGKTKPYFPSLVSVLKNQGEISKAQFALYSNFKGAEIKSNLMIGGYDLNKYSTESKFTYIPIASSHDGFWTLLGSTVTFGDILIDFNVPVVINSGVNTIWGPEVTIKNITFLLQSGYGCSTSKDGIFLCLCKLPWGGNYPDLVFELNREKFEIHPEDYMAELGNGYCAINIDQNYDDFWQLGDIFMRKYYISFDMDNERIGFAKAKTKSKTSSAWNSYLWKFILIIALNL